MSVIRNLDGIHPDTVRRRGIIISPGRRQQITREWGYLIGARLGRKSGTGTATVRFFTSAIPDEHQSDETQGQIPIEAGAEGAEASDDLLYASFENGIFVEVHATGSTATDSFILTVAWVNRAEFTPAFGDPTCQIREAWQQAPCREGTDLHHDYLLGEDQPEWDGAAGGLWLGDGVEYILDDDGDPIMDSANAALYSSEGD